MRKLLVVAALAGAVLGTVSSIQAASPAARSFAIAEVSGAGGQSPAISRALSLYLARAGARSTPLEAVDKTLAGAAASLKKKRDQRLLRRIRRGTDAQAVVLLGLDPSRQWVDVTVLDARNGASLLHAARRAEGGEFTTPDEVAAAAFQALSALVPPPAARPEAAPRRAASAPKPSPAFGIGVDYLGGHLACQPTPGTRLELHYETGRDGAGSERVTSSAAGLRGYWLFRAESPTRPYVGLDLAYLAARERSGDRRAAGAAGGAFVGIERRVFKQVWLGINAGPYAVYLREHSGALSRTDLMFVANTSLTFYLF